MIKKNVRKYQRLAKMWDIVLSPYWNCHRFLVGVKIGANDLKKCITLFYKIEHNCPVILR